MELVWYGLGCFRLMERGYPAVVTDPFDEESTGLNGCHARADIVTTSSPLDEPERAKWKGLRGPYRTLAGAGEYEIGGLFITAIDTFRDRKKGVELGQNVVYTFDCNGVVVCHLGELGHAPSQSQVEAMGSVQVLLLPVGIPGGLTPSLASEVVSLIEPNIIIPMQYKVPGLQLKRDPVDRFLKEMGVAKETPVPSLKLTTSNLPEETRVVLLELQQDRVTGGGDA